MDVKTLWYYAPEWVEWLAMDKDGKWYFFQNKPEISYIGGLWINSGTGYSAYVYNTPNRGYKFDWTKELYSKPKFDWTKELYSKPNFNETKDNAMTEEQYNDQQGISYAQPKSVCAWELKFSFATEKQTKEFIKLLLDSDLDLNFEYYTYQEDTKRNYAVCITGNWADTLTEVSHLLETVDHEGV